MIEVRYLENKGVYQICKEGVYFSMTRGDIDSIKFIADMIDVRRANEVYNNEWTKS